MTWDAASDDIEAGDCGGDGAEDDRGNPTRTVSIVRWALVGSSVDPVIARACARPRLDSSGARRLWVVLSDQKQSGQGAMRRYED